MATLKLTHYEQVQHLASLILPDYCGEAESGRRAK